MRRQRVGSRQKLIACSGLAAMIWATMSSGALARTVQNLAPGVQILIGQSSNVGLIGGPQGLVLVDVQGQEHVHETLAAIDALGGSPRFAINTHWHVDHSGANGALATRGAIIVGHDNARRRRAEPQFMAAYRTTIPAAPPQGLPTVTFDHEATLHVGSEAIRLVHAPRAHTDSDVIVWLERANVLFLGDLYFNGMFPFIDLSSGGDIVGLIQAIEQAAALANDSTWIVPAHGEPSRKADLLAYGQMLKSVCGRIEQGRGAGADRATVLAQGVAKEWAQKFAADPRPFVASVYGSLSAGDGHCVRSA